MNMKAISTRLRATNVFMSAMLRYLQFIGNGWYFWTIKYKHIYVRLIIQGCCPDFITWLYNSSHEPKPILPWYLSSEIGRNRYLIQTAKVFYHGLVTADDYEVPNYSSRLTLIFCFLQWAVFHWRLIYSDSAMSLKSDLKSSVLVRF